MMTEHLFEGNFCDAGLGVVLDGVASGRRSLALLVGDLRGVCAANGEHTCTCVQHFHHKRFKVPQSVLHDFVAAHWTTLRSRRDMVSFVHRARATPALSCVGVADTVDGELRAAVVRAVKDPGVRASSLAAVLHLLPRHAVLNARARVVDLEDTHGITTVNAYKRYLDTGTVVRSFAWQAHILSACDAGLAHLPAELRSHIKGYVFDGSAQLVSD